MAKNALSNSPDKSFFNIFFGETKICSKRMVLSTFKKQAISIFFCSNGLDMTQFDSERHFLLFFPTILLKKVFF